MDGHFSGLGSVPIYENTIKSVTLNKALANPVAVDRIIDVSVTNNNFITSSNIAHSTIEFYRISDPRDPDPTPVTPFVEGDDVKVPAVDNQPVSIDLDDYYTDADGDPLAFVVGALPSWLSYNSTTHVLSGADC